MLPDVPFRFFANISKAVSAAVVLLVTCRALATKAISSDVPELSRILRRDERKSAPRRIAIDVFHIASYFKQRDVCDTFKR